MVLVIFRTLLVFNIAKNKLTMRIAIGLIAVLLFLILMHFLNSDGCEVWIAENELNLSFNGKVASKFLDIKEKNQPRVILDDSVKYALYNLDIYNRVEIGDVLYKAAGTQKRYLIKGKDSILFYSRCGGQDVR